MHRQILIIGVSHRLRNRSAARASGKSVFAFWQSVHDGLAVTEVEADGGGNSKGFLEQAHDMIERVRVKQLADKSWCTNLQCLEASKA